MSILIILPKELQNTELHGKVFLYRPSDKQLDFELTFSKSTHYLLVPDNRLSDGRWNISVEIRHQDRDFVANDLRVFSVLGNLIRHNIESSVFLLIAMPIEVHRQPRSGGFRR